MARETAFVRFIPARAGNTVDRTLQLELESVHPRAGGEHSVSGPEAASSTGSSPRGRGTRLDPTPIRPSRRFIPARAGNTRCNHPPPLPSPVHPRAGGEHALGRGSHGRVRRFIPARAGNTPDMEGQPVTTTGSSPRGRGTQEARHPCESRHRFIPARAGNTRAMAPMSGVFPVHPRAGGEHTNPTTTPRGYIGSSPRGRGTHTWSHAFGRLHRFIPARAGNTRRSPASAASSSVHPRAGGEHSTREPRKIQAHGSSPRGRGTPRDAGRVRRRGRFIPARAGNTGRPNRPIRASSVHPRAGGEHNRAVPRSSRSSGSSPRGRGTRFPRHVPTPPDRFIPARAGNTSQSIGSSRSTAVHPRAGGALRHERFIPARAGNTNRTSFRPGSRPVHPRAGGEHSSRN